MFDFIKKLFGRGKKKKETEMLGEKMEFKALTPDPEEKVVVPETRYTEEYAEFNQEMLNKASGLPEKSIEEQMLEDPFADVAAQDEDVEIPAPVKEPEKKTESASGENVPVMPSEQDVFAGPSEGEVTGMPSEEEMLSDPFADVAAQNEDIEL